MALKKIFGPWPFFYLFASQAPWGEQASSSFVSLPTVIKYSDTSIFRFILVHRSRWESHRGRSLRQLSHHIHSWEAENNELKLIFNSRISWLSCDSCCRSGDHLPSVLDEPDLDPHYNSSVKLSVLEIYSNASGLFLLMNSRLSCSFSDSCFCVLYLKLVLFPSLHQW